MKKLVSLFLAVLMLFTSMSTGLCAFADNTPYVDNEGYYHRISFGEYIAFDTDYQRVLNEVYQHFMNHDTSFTVMYATSNTDYAYTDTNQFDFAIEKVWNKIEKDVVTLPEFTQGKEFAGAGDYLYSTIGNLTVNPMLYVPSGDNPSEGNVRYYPYKFTISNIEYFSNPEWEQAVALFAEAFSERYLSPAMTDYEKVKTIYDFVVRNTEYDYEVFNGEYRPGSDRYRIAHSAYGAIYGNILKDDNYNYDIAEKTIARGEKIIIKPNQGLAVCEGFSKLFRYLCVYNGIPCRIVDGDYAADSGRESDPHEWNYVYLDDSTAEGARWFQVDTTYASNKSYKEIDLNNYDYFLRGRGSVHFGIKEHQQPYYDGMDSLKPQLYEWDLPENQSSFSDYGFQDVSFSESEGVVYNAIIMRVTDYGGEIGERTSFIYTDSQSAQRLELDVDENGNRNLYATAVDGFVYNGHYAVYSAIIPYVVDEEIKTDSRITAMDTGTYTIDINGANSTSYNPSFRITPLDMSNGSNYDLEHFQSSATYRGRELPEPEVTIIDSFGKELVSATDFDIEYYNSNGVQVNRPKDLGNYTIKIVFKGNYKGVYSHSFVVEKIKLSLVTNDSVYALPYYPKAIRESFSQPIHGAEDYITSYQAFGVALKKGVDFTATSDGNLDYGTNVRYMTLTGIDSANSLTFGGAQYSRKVGYTVETKFDISDKTKLNLPIADTNTTNKHYYTGKPITPTEFDVIDKYLVQGKDYKIVGYENNTNVGDAYVIIQGINGCTGTLKLCFAINPAKPEESGSGGSGGSGGAVVKNITLYSSVISKLVRGKKSFTVKWSPVKGDVTGYKIQYSTSAKFKNAKTVTVKGAKAKSKTVKKLKAKKKYYVRIRTYFVYAGKTYTTPWSAKKSVKTK